MCLVLFRWYIGQARLVCLYRVLDRCPFFSSRSCLGATPDSRASCLSRCSIGQPRLVFGAVVFVFVHTDSLIGALFILRGPVSVLHRTDLTSLFCFCSCFCFIPCHRTVPFFSPPSQWPKIGQLLRRGSSKHTVRITLANIPTRGTARIGLRDGQQSLS